MNITHEDCDTRYIQQHKFKTGDIIQILNTEQVRALHDGWSTVYPKPYTMGIVKSYMRTNGVYRIELKYLGWNTQDNEWWHLANCVQYVSKRELRRMIAYYTLYKQSTWFSVRDFYDKVSQRKKLIEEALLEKMNIYNGCEYRVLCGNSQSFTAGFMMFNNLYVATRDKVYIIDTKFIEAYLQGGKE